MDAKLLHSISDEEYLDVLDLDFIMKQLVQNILVNKPDHSLEYSKIYFEKLRSCHHILGSDFSYIVGCDYNRRSFTYFCMECFQNMNPFEELTVLDFHQLLQIICPNIPLDLITEECLEVIYSIDHTVIEGSSSQDSNLFHLRYNYCDLKLSLFFHILYKEWLSEIRKLFKSDSTNQLISLTLSTLRTRMIPLDSNQIQKLKLHPPLQDGIEAALSMFETNLSNRISTEITYKKFKQALICIPSIQEDLCRKPKNAEKLSFLSTLSPRGFPVNSAR